LLLAFPSQAKCKAVILVLPNVMEFKNHTTTVHKRPSRPSEVFSQVNSDCVSEAGKVSPAECKQKSAGARAVHWLFMSDQDTANHGLLEMAR